MAKVVLLCVEIRLSTIDRREGKGHVELAREPPSGLDSSGFGGIAATRVLRAGVNIPKPKLI
jgi:hypothetical protein